MDNLRPNVSELPKDIASLVPAVHLHTRQVGWVICTLLDRCEEVAPTPRSTTTDPAHRHAQREEACAMVERHQEATTGSHHPMHLTRDTRRVVGVMDYAE